MVQVSLNLGWAILNAAGLSFIGLGVSPPTAEWGIMVAEGANFIVSGEWWLAVFPGPALMLAVFTFNLLGDGLRDIVDPQATHMRTAMHAFRSSDDLAVAFRTRRGRGRCGTRRQSLRSRKGRDPGHRRRKRLGQVRHRPMR